MWKQIGAVSPTTLTEARRRAHWAAQLVSAVGTTRLEATPDFSHTNLGWDTARALLVGRRLPDGRAAGLRVSTLTLALGDDLLALDGHTMDEALGWLSERTGGEALKLPVHEMPEHALADGARFSVAGVGDALSELETWLADASAVLGAFASRTSAASELRCWPHHFDVATLVPVPTPEGVEARSVGVGLSLGDGSYDEPYFYVTPWPYPDATQLPELPAGGHWHTQGWTGAVLPGSAVVGAQAQREHVEGFVDAAVAACRGLLA